MILLLLLPLAQCLYIPPATLRYKESPFLFTRYVRPMPAGVKQYLSSQGAHLFSTVWSRHSFLSSPTPPADSSPGVCLLPPEWGRDCGGGARIPQWTYSSSLATCHPYWYSGCGATNNLYSNEWKCRLQCSHRNNESLIVTVPTDEALRRFLTSIQTNTPALQVLLDDTFARKLLLGSMQVRGEAKSLRPQWEVELDSEEPALLSTGLLTIHLVDRVLAVDLRDLREAARALPRARALAISRKQEKDSLMEDSILEIESLSLPSHEVRDRQQLDKVECYQDVEEEDFSRFTFPHLSHRTLNDISDQLDSTATKILKSGSQKRHFKSNPGATIFLPRMSTIFSSAEEEKYSNLMQRILLSASVEGVYKFEWITQEDVVKLTSFRGDSLQVIYRNCSLYLLEAGGDSPATFELEEWVLGESLVIWATISLENRTGEFVGVSDQYIRNTVAKLSDRELCNDFNTS